MAAEAKTAPRHRPPGHTGRCRVPALAAALGALAAVAGCGSAPALPGRSAATTLAPTVRVSTPPPPRTVALPAVTGSSHVRAAWQGAPLAHLTISAGLLLGVSLDGHQVHALQAATGAPVWTATLRGSNSQVYGLVPAGQAVIAETGHTVGQAMIYPAVFDYVALDLATGRELWAEPVAGGYQSPPVAAAGNLLVTANSAGVVTARGAMTGAVSWRDPRPTGCSLPVAHGPLISGVALAADGALIVASFDCGAHVIAQRIRPATGMAEWTWRSPAGTPADPTLLSVIAVARHPGIVLLTGGIGGGQTAAQFSARLPRSYSWPPQLGPRGGGSTVLVLSASDGHPLWSESGGQQQTFALTDGAVCEVVSPGMECRDDLTGAATMADLLTGQRMGLPPYNGDGLAGFSDGFAAVTVAPFRSGHVTLQVVAIHGGAVAVQAELAIGADNLNGSDYGLFAVAAAQLPDGAMLVLVRRIDVDHYPVLALSVSAP